MDNVSLCRWIFPTSRLFFRKLSMCAFCNSRGYALFLYEESFNVLVDHDCQ